MKKATFTKNGMKQIVCSDWKTFNRQTSSIGTGNYIADTELGMYIRPFRATRCNGFEFKEGHLMDSDLEVFEKYQIPKKILDLLKDINRRDNYILYMFFTTTKEGNTEPFCWVLTDSIYNLITYSVVCGNNRQRSKRFSATREAMSYIIADV